MPSTDTHASTARRLVLAAALAASIGGPSAAAQAPPAAAAWSYETHCQKTVAEKRRLFREASPELKVQIGRTQIERWRDMHLPTLNAEQKATLNDLISAMTPQFFGESEEARRTLEAFNARIKKAFRDDQVDEFDRDGPCIGKRGGRP